MFLRCDLFLPDSKFNQIFITGTCKFMQIYASSCNNYASLLLLFPFILSPESSPLIQDALLLLFLLLVQGILLSRCFGLVRAFVRRWHALAKNKYVQAGRLLWLCSPLLFLCIGLSVTNEISCPTNLRCQKCRMGGGVVTKVLVDGPSFQFSGLWIEVQSLGGQWSESLNPVAFFRFAKVRLLHVDLFDHKIEKFSREWASEYV